MDLWERLAICRFMSSSVAVLKVRMAGSRSPPRCAPRNCPTLFRSRSSAGGHLRFVSERPGDERGPRFLSRVADHSPAEMGMSGHVHLFVDETGGAYSPDFARAPATLWRETENRRSAVYTFASPQRLAQATEKELLECALGYRAKNLLATARLVSSGEADLEAWSALSDAELRERLCALPGVGAKIANCVMLFAYERLRAFPIDVWIERVLREHYFSRKEGDGAAAAPVLRNLFRRTRRVRAAIFVSSSAERRTRRSGD